MMKTATYSIIVVFALLAGCATTPDTVQIPTLAELPTLTPVSMVSDTLTPLPPTPTTSASDAPSATTTPSATASASPLPAATLTPSTTLSPTITTTPTLTVTPSLTITDTPTATVTPPPPPTADNDAVTSLLALAMQATILPVPVAPVAPISGGAVATTVCAKAAPPGFSDFFAADVTFNALIGCPLGAPPQPQRLNGASQRFEHGVMLYVGDPQRVIYAISDDGRYRRLPDTWVDGVDPASGGEPPPAGLIEPIRGFGKVWRDNIDVRGALGWAREPEQAETLTVLPYERGQIVSPPNVGRVYALADDPGGQSGTWRGTSS